MIEYQTSVKEQIEAPSIMLEEIRIAFVQDWILQDLIFFDFSTLRTRCDINNPTPLAHEFATQRERKKNYNEVISLHGRFFFALVLETRWRMRFRSGFLAYPPFSSA